MAVQYGLGMRGGHLRNFTEGRQLAIIVPLSDVLHFTDHIQYYQLLIMLLGTAGIISFMIIANTCISCDYDKVESFTMLKTKLIDGKCMTAKISSYILSLTKPALYTI